MSTFGTGEAPINITELSYTVGSGTTISGDTTLFSTSPGEVAFVFPIAKSGNFAIGTSNVFIKKNYSGVRVAQLVEIPTAAAPQNSIIAEDVFRDFSHPYAASYDSTSSKSSNQYYMPPNTSLVGTDLETIGSTYTGSLNFIIYIYKKP